MSYSHPLVAASVTMSVLASYAAFCFAERITLSRGSRQIFWRVGGAAIMGLGIWSMHFLGMLAIHLSTMAVYSLPVVLLSLLLAILASASALYFVCKPSMTRRDLLLGSLLLGGGIGGMHYIGMAAMYTCAVQQYSTAMVGVSILIALVFAWMSLSITFRMRTERSHAEAMRVGGALVMGTGIAAMHYVSMAAVTFVPSAMPSAAMAAGSGMISIGALSGVGVGVATSVILLSALLAALHDRNTYRSLNEAHTELLEAHSQLALAQAKLLESEKALQNANRQLHELSIRDGLTKLYNRRHLDATLQAEWRRAERESTRISMMMIDVDSFKAYNDHYGHLAGDQALQRIAEALETAEGFVARYGGEEFAIIASMSPHQAEDAAERVRQAVYDLTIPHIRNGGHNVVSVSIGVCSLIPSSMESPESLIEYADEALYQAKSRGKNCVQSSIVEDTGNDLSTTSATRLIPKDGLIVA